MRSLLYVPGHSERFLARAHERGADAIIVDLEDAVPEVLKDAARDGLAESLAHVGQAGAQVFVRVNAGARQLADAEAACRAGAYGLVIAKAGDVGVLESLAGSLRACEAELSRPAMCFIAQLEDPGAVLDARAVAKVQRVIGLMTGGEDLATALGGEASPEVLRTPKLLVHYAAKAEGKLSLGLLRSVADYGDLEALKASAEEARRHGFDGASCVHPSGVAVLNAAFSPSADEIAWAQRVVAAAEGNDGAFALDGKMVDAPVVARARRILALG